MNKNPIKTYLKLVAIIVLHVAIVMSFIDWRTSIALSVIYLLIALGDTNMKMKGE